MKNRFFRWRGVDASPTEIVPQELLEKLPPNNSRYLVGILQHLDQTLPGAGLTFFLTWHLDAFHEAMRDSVVLLLSDEHNLMPSYQARVRAIFKSAGLRRDSIREAFRVPPSIALRVLLRDAWNGVMGFKRRIKYGLPRDYSIPTYDIPAGTGTLDDDVAPLPIEERPVDVFFAGGTSLGWAPRARAAARKQMAAAVAAARTALPQYRMESLLKGDMSKGMSPADYTRTLANAKIALAPRGNYSAESWRLFEAAKLGCVAITEPLPPRWYFQDCPAVSIRKWSQLPDVLRDLLHDPSTLQQLSMRSRQWWNSTVCEAAVAAYIAKQIVSSDQPQPSPVLEAPTF